MSEITPIDIKHTMLEGKLSLATGCYSAETAASDYLELPIKGIESVISAFYIKGTDSYTYLVQPTIDTSDNSKINLKHYTLTGSPVSVFGSDEVLCFSALVSL